MMWPGQSLANVPEDEDLTACLVEWLADFVTKHPTRVVTPETVLVSVERAREIITEVLILKRPLPPKRGGPVERRKDLR